MPGQVKYFVSAPNSVAQTAKEFRQKLKKHCRSGKLKKAKNADDCDIVLFFCPIVSRAGTDIEAALSTIQNEFPNKKSILIVLHHTFDPERIVSDSSKFVDKTIPTVDCLFHEDKGLLKCKRNSKAYKDVSKMMKSKFDKHAQNAESLQNKKLSKKKSTCVIQ